MKVKVKCEALGEPNQTKKGGYVRKFLVVDHAGEKTVITIYSANKSDLEQSGVVERIVDVDDFCFAPKA